MPKRAEGDKMKVDMDKIVVNDIEYVRADSVEAKAEPDTEGQPYQIIRTYSAGVFAGYLTDRSDDGRRGTVLGARRLWSWTGAASLSELAQRGTSNPAGCKFPCAVAKVELTEIIEVLDVTNAAAKTIAEVPIWTK
jgi:hypothetical protein